MADSCEPGESGPSGGPPSPTGRRRGAGAAAQPGPAQPLPVPGRASPCLPHLRPPRTGRVPRKERAGQLARFPRSPEAADHPPRAQMNPDPHGPRPSTVTFALSAEHVSSDRKLTGEPWPGRASGHDSRSGRGGDAASSAPFELPVPVALQKGLLGAPAAGGAGAPPALCLSDTPCSPLQSRPAPRAASEFRILSRTPLGCPAEVSSFYVLL